MAVAGVRGIHIHYEVLGSSGPWVALMPGGRRALSGVRALGERIAAGGYRVLLHDRRNCGASDVVIDGSEPEYGFWADDLHELLRQLGVDTVWVGGGSSGCRLSLVFALRYPAMTSGLLLWRITGGEFAANRLNKQYYQNYIAIARAGGMAAVCESEHFAECIRLRPENRARLMAMDPQQFIAAMAAWSRLFMQGAAAPVIGTSAEELRGIQVPACVIPGNDRTHVGAVGETLQRLLPDSELHVLYPDHQDVDMVPPAEWDQRLPEQAAVFLDFMKRHSRG